MTDVEREQGAFRWDWSIPFESYGVDAYGQVTFQNAYGIGSDSEGAVMAHGEYPITEDGEVKAAGNVQVKGYLSSQYSVQTQYEVTLYEWDVFVDGRADLMAWDMYLNLGARETQSAYHEYFLAIQVEEGQAFTLDSLNFIGNFDTGWYNPFHHELGISLEDMTIGQPYYEPASEEHDEDDEPTEEIEDTGSNKEEEPEQDEDTKYSNGISDLDPDKGAKEKSCGCAATSNNKTTYFLTLFLFLIIISNRRKS
jgi:hypothetical protein